MIKALLLTISIELPIVFLLLRRIDPRLALVIILINIITNLSLNLLLSLCFRLFDYIYLLELMIVFIEALLYYYQYQLSFKRLLLISLIANASSFLIGGLL